MTVFDRSDSALAGAFLDEQLTTLLTGVSDTLYPTLHYAELALVTSEVDENDNLWRYEVRDITGDSKRIVDYADDLPTADTRIGEVRGNVFAYGTSFVYSIDELNKARRAGRSLPEDRAVACKQVYERTCNKICYFGDPGSNLIGLFNNPTVDRLSFTGTNNDGWFTDPNITSKQMLEILTDSITYMMKTSRLIETPDTLVMEFEDHRAISTTQNEPGTDTTVLDFFLRQNPMIKEVKYINELTPENSYGNLTTKRFMLYNKADSLKRPKFHVPMSLRKFPQQAVNLAYKVPMMYKIGGVELRYPGSCLYVDQGV